MVATMRSLPVLQAGRLDSIDLADPRTHAECDISEIWEYLRTNIPAYRHHSTQHSKSFWVISRYDDAAAIYRDGDRFTSQRGNVLDTLLAGGDPGGGKMAVVTDGRRHADLRAIMLKAFSPRALARVVENIRSATTKLLADVISTGTCDFASDIAARIPLAAICDMMAVPDADRHHILQLTSTALAGESDAPNAEDSWAAKNEILMYFSDLTQDRRDAPRDDVVSLLARAEVAGEPLSHEEVVLNCYSLILGGDETTRYAMIGGALALIEHPQAWRVLKDGQVSVESAVEEVLRWTTPTLHAGRTATQDVGLHGELIETGDIVTTWNISANRDERKFGQPGLFDLSRKPNKHLTFAYGPHFCLGAYLARVEIGAVLTGLRDMVSRMELTDPPKPVYSNFLHGMSRLPVSFIPEPA
ncbi:MAG TPA: cytochrome P450 [Streptosporangiaceae bacterium]|jgi:cytochrome P450|nr:cytochrome P450 [Streptosporangiaceae bacterium]